MLPVLHTRLRKKGTLLMHFPLPGPEYRTESAWREDNTLKGRIKLRAGLNCFGRSSDAIEGAFRSAGFEDIKIEALAGKTQADRDIAQQHWVVAQKP